MLKAYGEKIKLLRVEQGISQYIAAVRCNVPKSTYARIEAGKCQNIPVSVADYYNLEPPKRAHGVHLKLFRQALDISQAEAARMFEVSLRTWERWETDVVQRGTPYHVLPMMRKILRAHGKGRPERMSPVLDKMEIAHGLALFRARVGMSAAFAAWLYRRSLSDKEWLSWENRECTPPADVLLQMEYFERTYGSDFLCWANQLWPLESIPKHIHQGLFQAFCDGNRPRLDTQQKFLEWFRGNMSFHCARALYIGESYAPDKYLESRFLLLWAMWSFKQGNVANHYGGTP